MTIVTSRPLPDAVVIKITGEVDQDSLMGEDREYSGLPNDNILDTLLLDSVTEPCKLAIVDLTDTRFLSSLGIATLVRFRTLVHPRGMTVRIAAGQNMLNLLKLGRLEMLIHIYADVPAALRG